MCFIKLILASAFTVLLNLHTVSSKECIYVQIGDDFDLPQNNYVECKNVDSMRDLAEDMKSDWRRLKIINDETSVFTNAGLLSASERGMNQFNKITCYRTFKS